MSLSHIDLQGRRKHLKLGGHDASKALVPLEKKGHFLEIKRALLCLLQNLGGARAHSAPQFLRLCRLACKSFRFLCDAADLGFANWVSRVRELQARYDILPSDNVSAIVVSYSDYAAIKSKVRRFFENHTLSNLNEHLVHKPCRRRFSVISIQPPGIAHASACQNGRRDDVMVHRVLKLFFCLALLFLSFFSFIYILFPFPDYC